jgi:hypothetical protein
MSTGLCAVHPHWPTRLPSLLGEPNHVFHIAPGLDPAPRRRPGGTLPAFPQHAVSVRYATEHRCGVVVRGAGLTDAISGGCACCRSLGCFEG